MKQATRNRLIRLTVALALIALCGTAYPQTNYPIVDTGQTSCYDNNVAIANPAEGDPFYGQDAQIDGIQPSYTISGDGLTVYDNITGLTWTKSPDTDRDGDIDYFDKLLYSETQDYADQLNDEVFGGYEDWRLPSIKELYSLMNFDGTDPSGPDPIDPIPYIDTDYFDFAYGDEANGDRIIDAQFWSSNECLDDVFVDQPAAFGLNLADGRIKGYPTGAPGNVPRYVYYVRGSEDYGINDFVDNGDGTITDNATGLMWTQDDYGTEGESGPRSGVIWEDALAYAQQMNDENYLGYSDWRLPNAKELQSIVDYARAPNATGTAAIDPLFNPTQITNESGEVDYPWYWSSTTHIKSNGLGDAGVYVCFGRGMGYMMGQWMDVHCAGCQRSDVKNGDFSGYNYVADGYYFGNAPQGDASRSYNYVMLVRDAPTADVDKETQSAIPDDFSVASAYPNPFNPTVTVPFTLVASGEVSLQLVNTLGQVVLAENATYSAGQHQVELDASGNASGVYLLHIQFNSQSAQQKVVLMK